MSCLSPYSRCQESEEPLGISAVATDCYLRVLPPSTNGHSPCVPPPAATGCDSIVAPLPPPSLPPSTTTYPNCELPAMTIISIPAFSDQLKVPSRRVVLSELRPSQEPHSRSCHPSVTATPAGNHLWSPPASTGPKPWWQGRGTAEAASWGHRGSLRSNKKGMRK